MAMQFEGGREDIGRRLYEAAMERAKARAATFTEDAREAIEERAFFQSAQEVLSPKVEELRGQPLLARIEIGEASYRRLVDAMVSGKDQQRPLLTIEDFQRVLASLFCRLWPIC
jgi:hypothetical protein